MARERTIAAERDLTAYRRKRDFAHTAELVNALARQGHWFRDLSLCATAHGEAIAGGAIISSP